MQYVYTLVYFSANWNPFCKITDKHIIKFVQDNIHTQVIGVDSDLASKIKRHYNVRSQPQFVFCLYGDQVIRQIGPNYQGLIDKMRKVEELSKIDFEGVTKKWQPYGLKYRDYYQRHVRPTYQYNVNFFN